jgi:hypothetical protein
VYNKSEIGKNNKKDAQPLEINFKIDDNLEEMP